MEFAVDNSRTSGKGEDALVLALGRRRGREPGWVPDNGGNHQEFSQRQLGGLIVRPSAGSRRRAFFFSRHGKVGDQLQRPQ
jgi:hypothetical protein